MKKTIFLSTLCMLGLGACTEENVTNLNKPEIELESPKSWQAFSVADGIHFEAHLHDNEALSQYNITIHHNFDAHEHGARLSTQMMPFNYSESFTVEGATVDVEQHLDLPATTAAGPYHLVVKAIDMQGNSTSFDDGSSKEVSILITNDSQAKVQLDLAAGETELDGTAGEQLNVTGTITDAAGQFSEITVTLGHEEGGEEHNHEHGRLKEEDHLYEQTFEIAATSEANIAELLSENPIVIPADVTEEHLMLIITVHDDQGNITVKRTPVHLGQ
jgi:hypothetical protein